jgi:hypothetical protein
VENHHIYGKVARILPAPATRPIVSSLAGNKIAAQGHRPLRLPPRGLPESQDREATEPVIAHKFQAGQMVKLIPSPYIRNSQGEFEILRVLPEEHGMHQYRIKSTADGVVRVVMESEIA